MQTTVVSVRRATPSTRIVRMAFEGGAYPFVAGQSAMIGEALRKERVPYSIACAPEEAARDRILEFLIKIEPSGRWGHQFDRIARGMAIEVCEPFGSFVFPRAPRERRFLFIAGGTGIAPIRSMIRHTLLARIPGQISLLFSARTPSDFAYLPELRRLMRERRMTMHLHVTREAGPRWRGERGRISSAHIRPLLGDEPTLCFVCGPEAMVADVPRTVVELGVHPSRVKVEEW